ncbi:MAG: iron-containing redox enzyme family protein, partial [Microcoleus sp. SIO2G3]|nr:iron-containing redox enzyme family protein [Microcoleus sp. SIO2G3]
HGRWMMDDVTLPLVDRYPQDAWEIVLGYDQEKQLGDRASAAVVRSIRAATETK